MNRDELAHELWATAQLAPGEGISDAVARMVSLLAAQPAEAEGAGDWEWLKLAAEVAEEDGPWEPRLGMTNVETAFAQSASPTKVLELIAALSAVTAARDDLHAELLREIEQTCQLGMDCNGLKAELRDMTAERDRLRGEVAGLRISLKDSDAGLVHFVNRRDQLGMEVDKLRAEVDELRVDAERYRWLRANRLFPSASTFISAAELDAAIDAAMAAKEG